MNATRAKSNGLEALLRRLTEHAPVPVFLDEAPLRADVFSLEQLVHHAKVLAENQHAITQKGSNRLLA